MRKALVVFSVVLMNLVIAGCIKPDLRVTDVSVSTYNERPDGSGGITYSFTVENRDYGGNILIRPGPASMPIHVQAYTSPTETLDNATARPAGGTVIAPAGTVMAPGQSISGTFSSSADMNVSERPYLILMVDSLHRVDEYKENNNTKSVRFGP